ncbi:MAG: hypothetical protein AAF998_05530 [Bacteroidota bacterium]
MNSLVADKYPVFVPGQVLSHARLNEIVNYLDIQDRISRVDLTGTGVACGLDLEWNGTSLNISHGFGLSSDGYILKICDATTSPVVYNRTRPFVVPAGGTPEPWYAAGHTGAMDDVLVLMRTSEPADPAEAPLSALTPPEDWAVALWLVPAQTGDATCVGNCDDIGEEIQFTLLPLLVKKTLITGTFSTYEGGNLDRQNTWRMSLMPMGLTDSTVPASLTQSGDLYTWYQNAVYALKGIIADEITEIHDAYKDIIGLPAAQQGTLSSLTSDLNNLVVTSDALAQYYYDYLNDLVLAYNEFADAAYYVAEKCCVDNDAHVRHVLLGSLVAPADPEFSDLRHYFQHSPALDQREHHRLRARLLFRRIMQMMTAFDPVYIKTQSTIRITPSADVPQPLSKRTIPYYYNLNTTPSLLKYWDPDAAMRGRRDELFSYYAGQSPHNGNDLHVLHPLEFNLQETPFFRVEGHINADASTAYGDLQSQITTHNLPFRVIALALPPTASTGWQPSSSYRAELCSGKLLQSRYDGLVREFSAYLRHVCQLVENSDFMCIFQASDERIPILPVKGAAELAGLVGSVPTFTFCDSLRSLLANDLPTDLEQFDYGDMLVNFGAAIRQAMEIRTFVYQVQDKAIRDRHFRYSVSGGMWLNAICRDVLDILSDFLRNAIHVELHEMDALYNQSQALTLAASGLPSFATQNAGLEHLAGVRRGGTFVLLYEDDGQGGNNFGSISGRIIGDFALPGSGCDDCEGDLVTETYLNAFMPTMGPNFAEVLAGGTVTINLNATPLLDSTVGFAISTPPAEGTATLVPAGDPEYEATHPKLRYVASSTAPSSGAPTLETIRVDVSMGGGPVLYSMEVYILVRHTCLPMLYAKDLYVAINNAKSNKVDLYVLENNLWTQSSAGPIVLGIDSQPDYGRATVLTDANGTPYIEYAIQADDDLNYQGIVPFEYVLRLSDGSEAIGSISVLVTKCCADGSVGASPVDANDYVWQVNSGDGPNYNLDIANLSTEDPTNLELFGVLSDVDANFITSVTVVDTTTNNDTIRLTPAAALFATDATVQPPFTPQFLNPNGTTFTYVLIRKSDGMMGAAKIQVVPAMAASGTGSIATIDSVGQAETEVGKLQTEIGNALAAAAAVTDSTAIVNALNAAETTRLSVQANIDSSKSAGSTLAGAETVAVVTETAIVDGSGKANSLKTAVDTTFAVSSTLITDLTAARSQAASNPEGAATTALIDTALTTANNLNSILGTAATQAQSVADQYPL